MARLPTVAISSSAIRSRCACPTLRHGGTVSDVAHLVHKDLERSLKYARAWGGHANFEGQQVEPDHALADGDIVELHA